MLSARFPWRRRQHYRSPTRTTKSFPSAANYEPIRELLSEFEEPDAQPPFTVPAPAGAAPATTGPPRDRHETAGAAVEARRRATAGDGRRVDAQAVTNE